MLQEQEDLLGSMTADEVEWSHSQGDPLHLKHENEVVKVYPCTPRQVPLICICFRLFDDILLFCFANFQFVPIALLIYFASKFWEELKENNRSGVFFFFFFFFFLWKCTEGHWIQTPNVRRQHFNVHFLIVVQANQYHVKLSKLLT